MTVDGRHYKVEFENEQVHDQTAAKADDVRLAGAATHAEENGSDQPADRIAVELK